MGKVASSSDKQHPFKVKVGDRLNFKANLSLVEDEILAIAGKSLNWFCKLLRLITLDEPTIKIMDDGKERGIVTTWWGSNYTLELRGYLKKILSHVDVSSLEGCEEARNYIETIVSDHRTIAKDDFTDTFYHYLAMLHYKEIPLETENVWLATILLDGTSVTLPGHDTGYIKPEGKPRFGSVNHLESERFETVRKYWDVCL